MDTCIQGHTHVPDVAWAEEIRPGVFMIRDEWGAIVFPEGVSTWPNAEQAAEAARALGFEVVSSERAPGAGTFAEMASAAQIFSPDAAGRGAAQAAEVVV